LTDGTRAPFQLFDALPAHIEDALRASIERFGVLVPVVRDQHGNVIDGHHRARIADALGVKYRVDVIPVDGDEAREIAQHLNSRRRHLNGEQLRDHIIMLAERATPSGVGELSQTEIAQLAGVTQPYVNQVLNDQKVISTYTLPESRRGTDGKVYPAKRPTVIAAKNEREAERAQEALTLVGEQSGGRVLDVKRIERIARETAAEMRRSTPVEPATVHGLVDIRHGDFRDVLEDLEAGSVDAIITDPPYPSEYWPLYADLGRLAHRVLRPNGVLAVMVGTRVEMVDEVDRLMRLHVCPRHRAVYLTPGQRWRDQTCFVATGYKPILIYSRIDAQGLRWINDDVFTSSGSREQDVRYHHWGQTESGFASLVERLTEPGALVVDPFLGGGTTAVVCRDLGRRFIGCDIDAAHVATSRERVG
jgi:site-specific DNA-methyltransferase (adenine-specific)